MKTWLITFLATAGILLLLAVGCLLLCATVVKGDGPVLGVAGAPPEGQWKGPWYTWHAHDGATWNDPQRAILHKLASERTGQPDRISATDGEFRWIEQTAREDWVRDRVWLAFNKPDMSNWVESGYQSRPDLAAQAYFRFWKAVKAGCPTCRVGGPNLYFASPASDWARDFVAYVAETGAVIEIWAIHDWFGRHDMTRYDWGYDLTVTYEPFVAHLDQLAEWRAEFPGVFADDLEVWVTETGGPLWAETQAEAEETLRAIQQPGVWGRVDRWYWFISDDVNVADYCPATMLWTLDGELTQTGRRWLSLVPGDAWQMPRSYFLPLLYFPGGERDIEPD